jgi:flagellar motility protein MotE (MotC chaperone)
MIQIPNLLTRAHGMAGICLAALLVTAATGGAQAEGKAAENPVPAGPPKVRVIGVDGAAAAAGATAPAEALSDVERYCTNISDPAKDARAALQTQRLQELEAQVTAKIDALEGKRKEYQDWLQQRQDFIESTSSVMLDIYAGMKPDAAAAQLSGLDRETAASLIAKMKPRTASAILAEMAAPVAAEIGSVIVQKTNKAMDGATTAAGPPATAAGQG